MPLLAHRRGSSGPIRLIAPLLMLSGWLGPAEVDASPVLSPLWSRSFDAYQHEDRVLSTAIVGNDGVLQLVRAYAPADLGYRLVLLRYEADGQLTWTREEAWLPGGRASLASAVDGTMVLAAVDTLHLLVRKFDGVSGDVIWERQRELSVSAAAATLHSAVLARDASSGQILVAVSDQDDFLVVRYAGDGSSLSDVRWGLAESVDVPTALQVRADGGFVVSGYENGTIGAAAYRTLAFDAAGTVVFGNRETGPIGNLFTPAWLALDQEGNTYVAGGPESACGLFKFQVWKLDPSGQRLWMRAGPDNACENFEPIGFGLLPDGAAMVVGRAGLATFGLARISSAGEQDWALEWGGASGGNRAIPHAFAINAEGRTRVVGLQPAGSGANLLLAEWAADATLCGNHLGVDNSGETVMALDDGWVVGGHSQFRPDTGVDALVARWPRPDCPADGIFADAFEAAVGGPGTPKGDGWGDFD